MYERALDLVGAHCDLEQRLRDIPPSARVRGLWVRSFENALIRKGAFGNYLEMFGDRASAVGWHACADVVARLAVAGALYASPAETKAGMRALARAQAVAFSESVLGRALIRLLSPDPVRVLQQGAAARRQTCNYGRWEHEFGPNRALVHCHDEYCWLDSQVLGSAEGTFETIGVEAKLELRLRDPYSGVIDITW